MVLRGEGGLAVLRQTFALAVVDLHVEGAGAFGCYQADAAHADHAEALACHLTAHHEAGAPILPATVAHQ